MGAIRLKAASDCHTKRPAASNTKKMHDRYLQHVLRWTTNAGSFECSSFVLLKPAAPSRSMAVCGIIVPSRAGRCARFLVEAGAGSRRVRGLWCARSRRSCWRSGTRNTVRKRSQAMPCSALQRRGDSSLSVFFALCLWPVRQRSGGGREAVERRTLDRFSEDESGPVPTTNRVSPRTSAALPAQNAATAPGRRIARNLKASINRHRTAEAQGTPRRGRRALCQTL